MARCPTCNNAVLHDAIVCPTCDHKLLGPGGIVLKPGGTPGILAGAVVALLIIGFIGWFGT
jgi:hypothetical protein